MDLTLIVDHQCNLRCRYCYTGRKFGRRMPQQIMQKAIDRALLTSPRHLDISFFGGEPLLHVDFLQSTSHYAEARIAELGRTAPTLRYIVNTNLTLLDDEALDWLRRSPATMVFTSLDGPAEINDSSRKHRDGGGSYRRVRAGLERLEQAKVAYGIVAVVTRESAPMLGSVVSELLSTNAKRLQLAPNFREAWTVADIAALNSGLRDAGDILIDAFRRGEQPQLDPFHSKILTHLQGGMPCPSRCRIAGHEWAVSPSGHIYPCAQMVGEDEDPALRLGDVDSGLNMERAQLLQRMKDRVEETCAECALRDRCQSHCGCRHLALSGELGRINAMLCDTEEAFINAADRVAETLFEESCPAFLDYYYERHWKPAQGAMLTPLRRSKDA